MIFWVTALPSEARPLIAALNLRRQKGDPFPHYQSTDKSHHLIVTGLGKSAAAAAVGWLGGAVHPPTNSIWINLGICGCQTDTGELGSLFAANKITDADTGQSWYPGRVLPFDPSREVLTVSRPEKDFRDNTLFDMEASGFYPTACRWSPRELVHCFKVVSDNEQTGTAEVTAKQVEQWIAVHVRQVIDFSHQLSESIPIRPENPLDELEEYCLEKWHFSHTRALTLRRFINLCHVAGHTDLETQLQSCKSASEVIQFLQDTIESASIQWK